MWWTIEWKQWNKETNENETCSDACRRWVDVLATVNDLLEDETVSCFTVTRHCGEAGEDDKVIMEYCP